MHRVQYRIPYVMFEEKNINVHSPEQVNFKGNISNSKNPSEKLTDTATENMSFEDLRKRARQLENEIDMKLVSFSKLATSYGSTSSNSRPSSSNTSDTSPLLSGDQKYETICLELEHYLNSLSEINDKMNKLSSSSSSATVHTLQRHRDILQDYSKEFHRTNATIKSRREREMLLEPGRNNNSITGLSRRDLYLKENDHISQSERMIDDQISIALETRDHLKTQREAFKMIQTKVNDLSNRFPMINTLMTKINFRRKKDALILGGIIGLCITFIIWWSW